MGPVNHMLFFVKISHVLTPRSHHENSNEGIGAHLPTLSMACSPPPAISVGSPQPQRPIKEYQGCFR